MSTRRRRSRIVRGTGSSAAPLELASSSDDEAAAQPAREPAREPAAPAAKRSDDEAAAQPAAKRPRVVDTLEALMRSARGSGRQPPWAACVCGIGDTSRCRALLTRYGCVIFRGVATGPECAELEGLFWDWLEREHPSVDRSRPATHAPHVFEALGYKNTGVVNTGSIGQSDFLWRARTLSRMVEAWRTVWGLSADERLLTSFDGAGVHRNPCHPVHAGRGVRTDQKWYHLDQSKPGFVGYQGVLTIFPATGKTGSTVVCPGSHKDHAENCARGGKQPRGPFVRLTAPGDAEYCAAKAVQLAPLGAGDLVVWDSRVVHCSNGAAADLRPEHVREARGLAPEAPLPSLLRLVAYIAMMPRSRASARLLEQRRDAVRRCLTSATTRSISARRRLRAPAGDDALAARVMAHVN